MTEQPDEPQIDPRQVVRLLAERVAVLTVQNAELDVLCQQLAAENARLRAEKTEG